MPKLLFLIILLELTSAGCRTKPVTVPPAVRSHGNVSRRAQQDDHPIEPHIGGWRKAEISYRKSYENNPSSEIRDKLLKLRFLIFIRQLDEEIPYPDADDLIAELASGNEYQKNLAEIAKWFRSGKKTDTPGLIAPQFKGDDPAFDSYIDLVLFQAIPRIDMFSRWNPDTKAAAGSPLFLYLNKDRLVSIDPTVFETAYPAFAEGFHYIAESMYERKKYRTARAFYQKAVELIPDYTKALVGLGNYYLYVLEDQEKALHYFEAAIKHDGSNPPALFGKAMIEHQRGAYKESDAALDTMLSCHLARDKWIDGVPDAQFYQGEAYYLKAYNHHLMNDASAREFADMALRFLPESDEIRYLSGLIYYQEQNLEAARQDFIHVARRGNYNCNAYLYLGYIYDQIRTSDRGYATPPQLPKEAGPEIRNINIFESSNTSASNYFLQAGVCMESVVGSLNYKLSTVDSLDFDPGEQLFFKEMLEKKLSDTRASSISSIAAIIDRISQTGAGENNVYVARLNEIISRLRTR